MSALMTLGPMFDAVNRCAPGEIDVFLPGREGNEFGGYRLDFRRRMTFGIDRYGPVEWWGMGQRPANDNTGRVA